MEFALFEFSSVLARFPVLVTCWARDTVWQYFKLAWREGQGAGDVTVRFDSMAALGDVLHQRMTPRVTWIARLGLQLNWCNGVLGSSLRMVFTANRGIE